MARSHPWDLAEAERIVAAHRGRPGAMLPILNALQAAFGHVHADAVPLIAAALNVSKAEVHGVVSFYHDYRDAPPGRHVLKLCRAEACQSMGADELIRHTQESLGTRLGGTASDRSVTIEAVYCLGNCALSPAVMLDGALHGRVSASVIDHLLGDVRASQ